ncbi:cupin-like domain-containing protein [uncultured Amphritea sp.]|uniref:cupin-like domain-containing protein n=1 Tax=uncultured Amphritea sp. TaxID=981605 RepID=UPI002635D750|nr:cupin-like domain-containing protein [uncultured Amphritea sp.]
MQSLPIQNSGFFDIARESSDISFEEFSEKYLTPEIPVIIEGVGNDWPARERWSEEYLLKQLAQAPTVSTASLWYWGERDVLPEDFTTPDFVNQCLDSPAMFPRKLHTRIWIHKMYNVSSWHYDANFTNVFNVQVKGKKEWFLISPDTPLDCYPYTTFAIMDGKKEDVLEGKRHTQFFLNEGDMVYIPPVWFHKVIACDKENININWLFTKRKTTVSSVELKRDLERYVLHNYLSNHRFKFVRGIVALFNRYTPVFIQIKWNDEEMTKTPYTVSGLDMFMRVLKENFMLLKTLMHVNKIKPYMKSISRPKKLDKIKL